MNKFLNGSLQSLLLGWLICNVCIHAEFVDLQAEPKFVAYSNSIDYSGHSIGEAFYHADTFAAINRNVMQLPARATGTHGLPSGITPSQTPNLGGVAERYGASTSAHRSVMASDLRAGAPHQGTSQLGSVSEHQASHSSPSDLRVDTSKLTTSIGSVSKASGSASSQISKEAQILLGTTNKYKRELFERAGKAKDQTSLNAAKIELQGGQIDMAIERGVTFDHVTKVRTAQDGLLKHIGKINARLSHPQCTMIDRKALAEELSKASKLLDHTEQFVPRTGFTQP